MKNGIIIGGGIGGLTTAIALRQKGIEATIYEQAPVISEVGAGVWVAPNGLKVIEKLGIANEITAAGKYLDEIKIVDVGGKTISAINVPKIKAKHGFQTLAIHRAELQKILYSHVPRHSVATGKRFKSYSQENGKVTAYFEDGTESKGDFLIAADGIHSKARQQMLPTVSLRYSGQSCWRFITAALPGTDKKRNSMYEIWAQQKGLRAAYSLISDNLIYCYITAATAAGNKDNPDTAKEDLLMLCNKFPSDIKELIQSAEVKKIIRTDLFDFKPIHKWVDGAVALLGDAAHATTPNLGQGACQAIEDAYCIAEALAGHNSIPAAFESYQKRRIAKATYITNTSWQFARITNTSGLTKQLIKQALRMTPEFINERQLDKIYSLS